MKRQNTQMVPKSRKRARETVGIRRGAVALALLMSAGVAAGAGYAAFSASGETTRNTFTIQAGQEEGKIDNDEDNGTGVVEPDWPDQDEDGNGIPDDAENLQPGSAVPKNPKFVSPLSYDAWVALKVEVPAASFRIGGDTKYTVHDCVILTQLNQDKKWELLYQKLAKKEGESSVYYYGYKDVVAGRRDGEKRGGETSFLFQGIQVPDITSISEKEDGTGFSGSVLVTPYAVQREGYESISEAGGLLKELAGLST